MPWDDTLLLVVTSGIASQLKDLSSQVLQDGSEVNYACSPAESKVIVRLRLSRTWGTGTDTLGIVALLQETMDTANRELEAGLRGSGDGLSVSATLPAGRGLSSFSCVRSSVRHE